MSTPPINKLILDVLGWTALEYCNYQFDSGIKQIAGILPDEEEAKTLAYSPEFWDAFKKNWNAMDVEFLENLRIDTLMAITVYGTSCPAEVMDMYKNYHNSVGFESLPVYMQRTINQQLYKQQRDLVITILSTKSKQTT